MTSKSGKAKSGASRTLVLLPFCLESAPRLLERVRLLGCKAEIIRDEGHLRETLKAHDPTFVIGICCPSELEKLSPMLHQVPFRYHAILMDSAPCYKVTQSAMRIDEDACLEEIEQMLKSESPDDGVCQKVPR